MSPLMYPYLYLFKILYKLSRWLFLKLMGLFLKLMKMALNTRTGKIMAVTGVGISAAVIAFGKRPVVLALLSGTVLTGLYVVVSIRMGSGMPFSSSPTTGREKYDVGLIDWRAWIFGDTSNPPVDKIMKRDPDGPPTPELNPNLSTMVLGQPNVGKSTFVKERIKKWDEGDAIIGHALRDQGKRNEFAEFFRERGRDVKIISSRDSDIRWDPFLDYNKSVPDMESLQREMFSVRDVVETGYTEAGRSLLVAALIVTYERYGDFARLEDVLGNDPEWIIDDLRGVPGMGAVVRPVDSLDPLKLENVYSTMTNHLRALFFSDQFDQSLDRFSIRNHFENPQEVIVLDTVRSDTHARGFWKLFLQSSIELALSTPGTKRFVLDEIDKLPEIEFMDDLASAGRSSNATGVLVTQDINQLKALYGEEKTKTMWASCPNRVCFRAGINETAELALSSLGDIQMEGRNVRNPGPLSDSDTSHMAGDRRPLPTGALTSLGKGKALIQTQDPDGWWLADLTEPEVGA